jgi:hypothetical protein
MSPEMRAQVTARWAEYGIPVTSTDDRKAR